jgi:hypothetical protein
MVSPITNNDNSHIVAETQRKPGSFWPYSDRSAVLSAVVLLTLLLVTWAVVETIVDLDIKVAWLLLGIVLVGLLPLLLHVLDGIARSGGSIGIGTARITLTAAAVTARSPLIPRNLGAEPGDRLSDAGNDKVLDTLKIAHTSTVVEVDLEDGKAWWETRLLILASGAARHGRPRALVFTAIRENTPHHYLGWAEPHDVRDRLLEKKADLRRAHQRATAITNQWNAREPKDEDSPGATGPTTQPAYAGLVLEDGLQDTFKEEKILAATLSELEPSPKQPTAITAKDLEALLDSVLHTHGGDETASYHDWITAALTTNDEDSALTRYDLKLWIGHPLEGAAYLPRRS